MCMCVCMCVSEESKGQVHSFWIVSLPPPLGGGWGRGLRLYWGAFPVGSSGLGHKTWEEVVLIW